MKGKVKYIDDKWVVEYTGVSYSGGNPKVLGSYSKTIETKTLPLHPENVEIFDVLPEYIKDGDSVKFKQVLVNPMGREVDPNNLGQNHSGCVWYAELVEGKEEQKQHLIDMMESDEELGLYDDILTLKLTKEDARGLLTCLMRTFAKGKDLDVGEMVEEQLVQFLKLK